jgi:radical SAM protein (TIGR01212 family)
MPTQKDTNPFIYSDSNKRYYTYDYFLRQKFGAKCAKLPIDGGFTCPNRDGTKGRGGCIFCSSRGSGDFCADSSIPIDKQLANSYETLSRKWKNPLGIAYFQAFTNTYAPLSELQNKFETALSCPWVVGLSIATRADCLADDICGYLAELAERTFLTVELGLQTAHDSTAAFINRGHTFHEFIEGFTKLRAASPKINICIHLINGLPGETADMMLENARRVAVLHPEQVKIHLLHVIEETKLCELYREGKFNCLTLDEFAEIVVNQLELLPQDTVIGRLTGDGLADTLVAPLWSRKKFVVMNTIDKLMYERNTWQGRLSDSI